MARTARWCAPRARRSPRASSPRQFRPFLLDELDGLGAAVLLGWFEAPERPVGHLARYAAAPRSSARPCRADCSRSRRGAARSCACSLPTMAMLWSAKLTTSGTGLARSRCSTAAIRCCRTAPSLPMPRTALSASGWSAMSLPCPCAFAQRAVCVRSSGTARESLVPLTQPMVGMSPSTSRSGCSIQCGRWM